MNVVLLVLFTLVIAVVVIAMFNYVERSTEDEEPSTPYVGPDPSGGRTVPRHLFLVWASQSPKTIWLDGWPLKGGDAPALYFRSVANGRAVTRM